MDNVILTDKLEKLKYKVQSLDEEYEIPELQGIVDGLDSLLHELDSLDIDDYKEEY